MLSQQERNYLNSSESKCRKILEDIRTQKIIPDNSVFFDIGCNYGQFSKIYANFFKPKSIYAFEPVTDIYQKAQSYFFNDNHNNNNHNNNNNYNIYNFGLSNKVVENTIYINPGSVKGWNTMLDKDPHQPDNFTEKMIKQTAKCQTLNNFCQDNNIIKIDFIKIDVEGYETYVLEGGMDFLKQLEKKPYLFIEVGWGTRHPYWDTRKHIYNQLFDIGYKKVEFDEESKDILFIPQDR